YSLTSVFFTLSLHDALPICLFYLRRSPGQFNINLTEGFSNRWQKEGDISAIGRLSINGGADPNGNLPYSDKIITDASFIRLKNLDRKSTRLNSSHQIISYAV